MVISAMWSPAFQFEFIVANVGFASEKNYVFLVVSIFHLFMSTVSPGDLPFTTRRLAAHLWDMENIVSRAGRGWQDRISALSSRPSSDVIGGPMARYIWLPSGKHTKNHGKSSFLMGKSTISMAIFNSYLKFPGGSSYG